MKFSLRCSKILSLLIPALFTLTFPTVAHAHVGAGAVHGFMHGLAHPLSGLDHICAMFAVGLWAAQMGGRATWRVPASFVSVMILGGLLGMAAVPVPFVEGGIAMSLLVLGVLIAAAVRLPLLLSAAIVGVFAVFHGYAHGAEMPQDASGLEYAAGFVLATALLHACGIAVALLAKNHGRARWLRLSGAAIALCGGGILFAG
jgi:urease accessory protein